MSNRTEGGPAFPAFLERYTKENGEHIAPQGHPGMSLRSWLAGQALPAVINIEGQDGQCLQGETRQAIASISLDIADELLARLAERDK